ncbi:MAG: hypothetical protein ACP5SI_03660 [Chloroflexia bacterium]
MRPVREPEEWRQVFLLSAFVLGSVVRLSLPLFAGFPINDGGLFYVMVKELQGNRYVPPVATNYNGLHIPFVYPPLSLYLVALLAKVLPVPLEELFRWLPAIVSTATVPAFYGMARSLLRSPSRATLATVAYALVPRSYCWLVMGGGLGRALGQFFLIGTLWAVVLACREPSWRALLRPIGWGTLVLLAHPEVAFHMVPICLGAWLFLGQGGWKVKGPAVFAAGVAVGSSPWWIYSLARYGTAPFLSAVRTGHYSAAAALFFLAPGFAQEEPVTVWTVAALLGVFVALIRKEYFLLYWLVVPFLVEPRNAPTQATLPLALLAGLAFSDVFVPGIRGLELASHDNPSRQSDTEWTVLAATSPRVRGMLFYLVFVALLGSAIQGHSFLGRVTRPERWAMDWVRSETPQGSRFLVLSGAGEPFLDWVSEWFPALTDRISLNTLQGREWLLESRYMEFRQDLMKLQTCLNSDPSCVEGWASKYGYDFDYLYVVKEQTQGLALATAGKTPRLLRSLLAHSPHYRLVYDSEAVAIYQRLTHSPFAPVPGSW